MWWKPIKDGVIGVGHNKRKGIRLKAIHHEGRQYVGCLACDLFRVCHNGIMKTFICQDLGYTKYTIFKRYEDSKKEG